MSPVNEKLTSIDLNYRWWYNHIMSMTIDEYIKAWNSLPQEERCKLCREWTEESAKKDSVNEIRNVLLILMCIPAFECFNHGSISKFFEEFGFFVSAILVAWVIRDIYKSFKNKL